MRTEAEIRRLVDWLYDHEGETDNPAEEEWREHVRQALEGVLGQADYLDELFEESEKGKA